MSSRGSVLVGVLWCVALLSVVVIGTLHTAQLDLVVVKNHGDKIQAHYLALAGVEKAKAVIYHDMLNRRRTSSNHSGQAHNNPKEFENIAFGRGHFRVARPASPSEGSQIVFGVADEESRLNVNTANAQELTKLQGMTPDLLGAIQDWRDGDNTVSAGGAEAEYYATLTPPRLPQNGPFRTMNELLMVRGITTELLFGETGEERSIESADVREKGDLSDVSRSTMGWADILTVHSRSESLSAGGNKRVNVQNANESELTGVRGITSEIAKAIIARRGENEIKNIADLLEVTAAQNRPNTGGNAAGNRSQESGGQTLISDDLLIEIADEITVGNDEVAEGLINVNTAPTDVLVCLDGMSPELAQAIVSHRSSSGFFANTAALLKVPGMTRSIFKQLAPRLTARSETFRISSEGKVDSSGVRERIETIVHVSRYTIETLSYREGL